MYVYMARFVTSPAGSECNWWQVELFGTTAFISVGPEVIGIEGI